MAILDKNELNLMLSNYYKEHFGELESDKWYEQPAANVWMFEREGKLISLKVNIKNGEIEVYTELF